MELLILPSVLAISIKIGIFLRYHTSLSRENLDLGLFFVAVFFLNIFEMLSIQSEFSPDSSLLILLAYYCCVVFTVHGFINVALKYSQFDWHSSRIRLGLNALLALLIVNIIFNRNIIAGVEPMNAFTLTRIAGDGYWVIQSYLVLGLAMAVALLIRGMIKADTNIARQKCMVVMVSAAAPVLTAVGVVALMAAGININAAIFMSLAMSLMLGLIVFAEEKSRLFRLLTFLPYTRERQLHKQLLAKITDCVAVSDEPDRAPVNLKQVMKDLEGSVVEHVLDYYQGNQKKAAHALGVSEATLSRRARACQQRHYSDSVAITE
jgi:hypothetical protein